MMPSAMRSFAYGPSKALREIQSSTQAHAHFLSRRVSDHDIDVTPLTTIAEVTTEHFECSFLSCVKIRDAVTHVSYLLCYGLPNQGEDTPNKFLMVAPNKSQKPHLSRKRNGVFYSVHNNLD
jgi:hypothetical protein